jgi:hypothetical protein
MLKVDQVSIAFEIIDRKSTNSFPRIINYELPFNFRIGDFSMLFAEKQTIWKASNRPFTFGK